ncbi:MAG: hypothetical protein LBK73_01420 [Treponema sp.]|nr:hypothetical protein [Treponema sp.]
MVGLHDYWRQFQTGDDSLRDQGVYNRTMASLPIMYDASTRLRCRNLFSILSAA